MCECLFTQRLSLTQAEWFIRVGHLVDGQVKQTDRETGVNDGCKLEGRGTDERKGNEKEREGRGDDTGKKNRERGEGRELERERMSE